MQSFLNYFQVRQVHGRAEQNRELPENQGLRADRGAMDCAREAQAGERPVPERTLYSYALIHNTLNIFSKKSKSRCPCRLRVRLH